MSENDWLRQKGFFWLADKFDEYKNKKRIETPLKAKIRFLEGEERRIQHLLIKLRRDRKTR